MKEKSESRFQSPNIPRKKKKTYVDSFDNDSILPKQHNLFVCKVDFARANLMLCSALINLNLDNLNPYLNNGIVLKDAGVKASNTC